MQNEFAGVGSDLLAASAVSVDSFGRTVDGVRLLEDSDSDNVFDLDTDAVATMSYQYYADDLLKSVTDPRGNSTGYRYDALSRLSAVRGAAVVENRDHDTSASAPAFRTEQVYLYDSAHQLRFVIDPTGIVTESTYDHLGNLDQLQVYTDAVAGDGVLTPGTVTEKRDYDFDGFSRLVHEIRGDRNDSLFAGSASNDFSIQSSFYDQLGRVTVREEGIGPESGSTQLEYDNVHRTTKLIDPNQNETAWSYDDLGRVISESIQIGTQANPTSVSRTYFYDSLSNLVQSVDRNGRLIRYDYDDLHLLETERWYAPAANPSDPTDAGALQGGYDYDFDSLGRLKSVGDTAAEQLYQYRYDEGSRLVAELQTFAGSWTGGNQSIGFERDYDAYDNLVETRAFRGASFSIDGQSIDTTTSSDDYVDTRLYDAQNRLESITRGADVADGIAALHVAFGYDNAGRQSRVNRYHGSDDSAGVSWNTVLDYDEAGRLTTITHSDPLDSVNPLSVYERVFSQAGAIESTTVTLGTTEHLTKTYSQDNRGQVISEAYFSGSSPSSQHTTRSYGPDAAGNRVLEVIQSQTHHHTIERDNRLVSDSRWSYTHDDEGNVTSKTSADGKSLWQYAWDHRNRLIEATLRYDASGNVSATSSITRTVNQTYDGLDRWIGSENSETGENHLYVHDSGQLTLEFVDGAVENRYLWADGVDQLLAEDGAAANEEPRWTLTDHLGSVRDIVSETTSLSHTDYDAFGNVEGTAADLLFGYTARPYDESTDLQNNHHRWYDAESGRWVSQDPSGLEPDANPYRYVSNQPMTLTDPSGLEPPEELAERMREAKLRRALEEDRKYREAIWYRRTQELPVLDLINPVHLGNLLLQDFYNWKDGEERSVEYRMRSDPDVESCTHPGFGLIGGIKGGRIPRGGIIKGRGPRPTPRNGAQIADGKFDYLFGNATGAKNAAHNAPRTAQNAAQMRRLGIWDDATGRARLQSHFDDVVNDPTNVTRRCSNKFGNFETRESLFAGPSGQFVKFESTWEVLADGTRRLTTVIPFGGQ